MLTHFARTPCGRPIAPRGSARTTSGIGSPRPTARMAARNDSPSRAGNGGGLGARGVGGVGALRDVEVLDRAELGPHGEPPSGLVDSELELREPELRQVPLSRMTRRGTQHQHHVAGDRQARHAGKKPRRAAGASARQPHGEGLADRPAERLDPLQGDDRERQVVAADPLDADLLRHGRGSHDDGRARREVGVGHRQVRGRGQREGHRAGQSDSGEEGLPGHTRPDSTRRTRPARRA
jgi:hypothetical protein